MEKELAQYLKKGMGKHWHMSILQEKYTEGIPDISFGCNGINGFIELKEIEKFPKKDTSIVKIPHAEERHHQKQWLLDRTQASGSCFVLVHIVQPDLYYLFYGDEIALLGISWRKVDWDFYACGLWEKDIAWDEFEETISQ